jgi:hypothetical protein
LKEEFPTDTEVMTSKEGNLAVEDIRDRKKPIAKPTKYHYYPHNQHLYLLPECATQQVNISFLLLFYYFTILAIFSLKPV